MLTEEGAAAEVLLDDDQYRYNDENEEYLPVECGNGSPRSARLASKSLQFQIVLTGEELGRGQGKL